MLDAVIGTLASNRPHCKGDILNNIYIGLVVEHIFDLILWQIHVYKYTISVGKSINYTREPDCETYSKVANTFHSGHHTGRKQLNKKPWNLIESMSKKSDKVIIRYGWYGPRGEVGYRKHRLKGLLSEYGLTFM